MAKYLVGSDGKIAARIEEKPEEKKGRPTTNKKSSKDKAYWVATMRSGLTKYSDNTWRDKDGNVVAVYKRALPTIKRKALKK